MVFDLGISDVFRMCSTSNDTLTDQCDPVRLEFSLRMRKWDQKCHLQQDQEKYPTVAVLFEPGLILRLIPISLWSHWSVRVSL